MAEQFAIENGILNKYLGNEDVVTIPKEVTTIGSNAFEKNGTLQMLILNEGLEVIKPYAFFKCENLESVRFPSTLKKIGMLSFGSCTSLGTVSLPEGLEVIGDMAFTGCNNLHSVKLPDTVKRVSMSAFPPTLKVNQKKEESQQGSKTDKTVFSADAAAEEKSILEKGQDVSIPEVAQKATTSIEEEKPSKKAAEKEMVPSMVETKMEAEKKQEPDTKIPQEQSGKRSGRKKMPVRFIYILVLLVIGAGIFFVRNDQSKKNADAVSFKIDSIGVVTIDSEPAITAAEKEYAALKKKEKEMVANHSALVDARSSYTTISKIVIGLENFDAVSLDNLGQAKSIISLIDQLPEAERGQYVARRNEIETEYNDLVTKTISSVEQSISAIGTVELTKEQLIKAARYKYDKCPADIQKQISNVDVLVAAEQHYSTLKEVKEKVEEAKKKQKELEEKNKKWERGKYVDEFGQVTGEYYVTTKDYIQGEFSNSATNNSNLIVDVLADKENVYFKLYEYGMYQVKNSSSRSNDFYDIVIKDSSGNKYNAGGIMWAGGGDRICIDETCYDIQHTIRIEDVKKILSGTGTVTFYISDSGSSRYLFEVECSNFAEEMEKLM